MLSARSLFRRYLSSSIASLCKMSTSTGVILPVMNIDLTEDEDRLCTLLDDCTGYLREEKIANVTCRIAGGWVRDKLLGLQCNDIDLALSDIMGLPFAEHLAAFANQKGIETGTITKIAQNPDQSKHLETATLKVYGLDIDLVNLRSEEYADDSRIPMQVAFGTPLQDALRRDTTINSLFYNIHTRSVEDFTEKGIADLCNGTIRTPLPPEETFLDDPLRILRCIRFAARFGFTLIPEIKKAAKDPAIQNALVSKITRERVGEEIAKMIKGRDPILSIRLIHELLLYDAVFAEVPLDIKATFSETPAPSERALASASILHALLNDVDSDLPPLHPSLFEAIKTDASSVPRLYLASMLTPFADATYVDKKHKLHPAAAIVIRESLRLGTQNHYLDGIPPLFAAHQLLRDTLDDPRRLESPSPRLAIGTLLRQKTVHNPLTGSHWTSSILFSLVQDLNPCYRPNECKLHILEASTIIERYNSFLGQVEELDLGNAAELKPLLDGRELLKVVGASKGGPWTSELLTRIVQWQLENPERTKDACIQWLGEEKEAGRLSFIDSKIVEPASKRARTK